MESIVLDFWGNDLHKFTCSPEISKKLPIQTVQFLKNIGLPDTDRILNEKRKLADQAAFDPSRLSWRDIKGIEPHIDFSTIPREITFQDHTYIRLSHGQKDIGISFETSTGKVYFIYGLKPTYMSEQYFTAIRYTNSTIDKCIYLLTLDLITKRQIAPLRNKINQETRKIMAALNQDQIPDPMLKQNLEQLNRSICHLLAEQNTNMRQIDHSAFMEPEHFWRFYMDDQLAHCIELL